MERVLYKMNLPLVTSVKQESTIITQERNGRRLIFILLYLLSLGLLIWCFADGYSYYTTPFAQRPHHPDYRALRPAGSRGLIYGITGASMMILMLVYSIRKRSRRMGRSISLRSLLNFHIYLGIVGPLFVVLHTSFKVQGMVAVSFWSMVAVALSGYSGRYLYLQIPRNIQGNELTLQEITETDKDITEKLKTRFQLKDTDMNRVDTLFENFTTVRRSGLGALMGLIQDDLMRWPMKYKIKRSMARILPLPSNQFNALFAISFRRALLNRRIQTLSRMQRFFHYWHAVHKPVAIVMYLIMCLHIGIAVWTGYAWVH